MLRSVSQFLLARQFRVVSTAIVVVLFGDEGLYPFAVSSVCTMFSDYVLSLVYFPLEVTPVRVCLSCYR
jgi:hypothetical protein